LSDIYNEPSSRDDSSTRTQKTRSITFRLDCAVIDELQREADQKETSLNVLVNQVLKRYTEWDRYESKIGMMPVPKVMLSSLIDKSITIAKDNIGIKDIEPYKAEILKSAAQIAFSVMKDSVLFMKK
jgi:hypothetical protein